MERLESLFHQLHQGHRPTDGQQREACGGESQQMRRGAMAVRLYSVLTSYLRSRPLKLVRHMKDENGFEAWQRLLRDMQLVMLWTQLSRVQFAHRRAISEQLLEYDAIREDFRTSVRR